MALLEAKLCTVCETETLVEYDKEVCLLCNTKKIITKVVCIKCNNTMTTISMKQGDVQIIKAFCYPCNNDSWQEGCDLVSKQMMRSLK